MGAGDFACTSNTTATWTSFPLPSPPSLAHVSVACQRLCDSFLALQAPTPATRLVAVQCDGVLTGSAFIVRESVADCLALCNGLRVFELATDDASSVATMSTAKSLLAGAVALTVCCGLAFGLYKTYRVLRARRLVASLQTFSRQFKRMDSMVQALSWHRRGSRLDMDVQTLRWEHDVAKWVRANAEVAFYNNQVAAFASTKDAFLSDLYHRLDSMVDDEGGVASFTSVLPAYQAQIRLLLDECDANDNRMRDHVDGAWRRRLDGAPQLIDAPIVLQMQTDERRVLEDALAYQRSRLLAEIELTWTPSTTPMRKMVEMQGCVQLAELVTTYARTWAAFNESVLRDTDLHVRRLHEAIRDGNARSFMEAIWNDLTTLAPSDDDHATVDADGKPPLRAVGDAARGASMDPDAIDALVESQAAALSAEYEAQLASLAAAQDAELLALRSQMEKATTHRVVDVLRATTHASSLADKVRGHEAACVKERANAQRVAEMAAAQAAAAKRRLALQQQRDLDALKAANEAETQKLNEELATEQATHQARLLARVHPVDAIEVESSDAVLALQEERAELERAQVALLAEVTQASENEAALKALHEGHAREAARVATELEAERAAHQARLDARLAQRRRRSHTHDDESPPPVLAALEREHTELQAQMASDADALNAAAAAKARLEAMQAENAADRARLDIELRREQAAHDARLQARLQKRHAKNDSAPTPAAIDDHSATVAALLATSDVDRARLAQLAADESESKHAQLMARLEEKKRRRSLVASENQRLAKKLADVEQRKQALRLAEDALAKQAQASAIDAMAAEAAYAKFMASRPKAAAVSFEKVLADLVAHEDDDVTLEQIQIVEAFGKVLEARYKARTAKKKTAHGGKIMVER
ncbi:hypothetical protein SPRG_22210 [Saprolegnia parasitica CBS 223.65]|uniref:Uncharacterized protein n=1 Tax=Saprolegnia parasitica (strain CBS 223.65) TaxID=695850 RepID=A0A067CC38_SAPPC|nr:hypothetical protein SPRG_22210 [Saprolegnia parasitica CBS 223.65]KDO26710.1 hypothetical protein SPRG_22210 [Saprolegnia parasitica CBS 223.65]|eukprot:XP_012202637.1 hypothetical protein SPRG_22210 [Saprolegnia parasitica CBS 223.65]